MILFRLIWIYLRVGVLNELEYRANFVFQAFQSLVGLATALLGLSIVFNHTKDLNGWTIGELIGLLGVYFLVGGIIRLVLQPSLTRFMEDIRQGTLDFTLTKPADAQILVSIRQVEIWNAIDVLLGLGLIVYAVTQRTTAFELWQAGAFVIALIAGCAMVYSFWMILATCTFWFVRIDNIMVVFLAMWEAGRWPVGIYPDWLRYGMTFLVPVAFATTVPAEALAGTLTLETLAGAVALAVVFVGVSRWFWTIGIRRYSGASA